jgi:hypothetical protein
MRFELCRTWKGFMGEKYAQVEMQTSDLIEILINDNANVDTIPMLTLTLTLMQTNTRPPCHTI